jgi:hypothetical protein
MATEPEFSVVVDLEQDCRCEKRVIWFKPLNILPCKSIKDWAFRWVKLIDASPSGVGFLCDEPMAAGEQFFVRPATDRSPLLLYEVKHCTPTPDGPYQIGAQFLDVIASRYEGNRDSALDALIADLVPIHLPTDAQRLH